MLFLNRHKAEKQKPAVSAKDFEDLYRAHKSLVYGVALRYLRCRDDANDAVQETFISIYTNFAQYNPEKPLIPWIKKIAINSCLMYMRSNYRYKLTDSDAPFEAIAPEIYLEDERASAERTQREMLDLLHLLPDGYRMVFNLYAIDGLTHKEIAEYLEISESTSRTQLLKARKMIKGLLESKMQTNYERA